MVPIRMSWRYTHNENTQEHHADHIKERDEQQGHAKSDRIHMGHQSFVPCPSIDLNKTYGENGQHEAYDHASIVAHKDLCIDQIEAQKGQMRPSESDRQHHEHLLVHFGKAPCIGETDDQGETRTKPIDPVDEIECIDQGYKKEDRQTNTQHIGQFIDS